MQTHRFPFIALVSILTAATGCDTESRADATEFRNVPYVAPWDSVKCVYGTSSRCFAHSPSGGDTVSPVVSWCDIYGFVSNGTLTPTADGWFYGCDYDGGPETFDEAMCFYDSSTHVVCYGGSDGWYTEVTPTCVASSFVDPAWPVGTCDIDSSPGAHQYDSVLTVPGGTAWWGKASLDSDSFTAVPSCTSANGASAADPFACADYPDPCCSCDAEGGLVCVSLENGECPEGTSASTWACPKS